MDLKAMNMCYKSIEIFASLVSILHQYSSPNCHSKKSVTLVSTIVLDSNIILSDLNDLDVPIGSIGTRNRPKRALIGAAVEPFCVFRPMLGPQRAIDARFEEFKTSGGINFSNK
jgi:hypothetical protein